MSEEKKESEIKWHQFEQRMCKIALTEGREASEVLDEQARAEKLWDAMIAGIPLMERFITSAIREMQEGQSIWPCVAIDCKNLAQALLAEWEKGESND